MEYLNGIDIFKMFQYGTNSVLQKRKILNDINVFPVPDGDTGNNLAYTLQTISSESIMDEDLGKSISSISEAALIGARGNSGVIFAQFVNGLRKASKGKVVADINAFCNIVLDSAKHVYSALSNPVEGTMITVMKDWANYLNSAKNQFSNFKDLFFSAYKVAKDSLERTKTILDVLKKNDVVDSGAMGFVAFLEGFNLYVSGAKNDFVQMEKIEFEDEHHFQLEITYRYCTEGLVEFSDFDEEEVKEALQQFGDSIIVVKGERMFRTHIHTNTPSLVFDVLGKYGHIRSQKVDDMALEINMLNSDKKTAIVTDSIADLDDDFILNNHIFVIPLNVIINGISYLDKLTINNQILFEKAELEPEYPTTATPTIKYINNLFTKLLLHFEEIIIISVSSRLSGTYEVLQKEVEKLSQKGQKVVLIDSLNNSATEGLLVREAVEMLNQGYTLDEIVLQINEDKQKTQILVCLDTFKYALKGGRLPKVVGKIGMAFKLRPIMSLTKEGKGTAFGISLSQKGITRRIVKLVKKDLATSGIKQYSLVHCQNKKLMDEYEELFTKLIGFKPTSISEISSATAIHSGIGSVAIGYIKK